MVEEFAVLEVELLPSLSPLFFCDLLISSFLNDQNPFQSWKNHRGSTSSEDTRSIWFGLHINLIETENNIQDVCTRCRKTNYDSNLFPSTISYGWQKADQLTIYNLVRRVVSHEHPISRVQGVQFRWFYITIIPLRLYHVSGLSWSITLFRLLTWLTITYGRLFIFFLMDFRSSPKKLGMISLKKTASTGIPRPKCCPPGALGATTCRRAESSLRGDVETLPGGRGVLGVWRWDT